MNKKVTIATITYNSAPFLRQAIESVLAQSYTNFEYLISDDCSSDGTWEIVQSYQDSRIRAWRNEPNLGEYPNRNKTLNEAQGEYIIWIDGDDMFYPHGLEFMVRMLDAFPKSAMACARPYWPNMVYPFELTPEETFKFDYLGSPVTINGFPDTLFKTSILREVGGLPENYISGDTFVKKKIAMYYNILLISDGVSWWRTYQGQASSKIRGTVIGYLESLKIALHFLNHKDLPLNIQDQRMAQQNIYAGFSRYLLKEHLFRGRLINYCKLINKSGISFVILFRYSLTRLQFPMSHKRTSKNPFIISFKRNPYAK